jgi:predicted ester cyclase
MKLPTPMIAFSMPILASMTEVFRSAHRAFAVDRRAEFEASRRRLGVTAERGFLQRTPNGDLAVVVFEVSDPTRLLTSAASSTAQLDADFRSYLLDVFGLDLTQMPATPPSEQVFDWHGGAAIDRTDIEKLIRRWTREAIAEGHLDVFNELLAPDALDRSGPAPALGVESFKARAAGVRAAFSDIQIVIDDLVVDGDTIAWRWTLTGVHVGSFAGLAPTDRRAALRGVNFQRIENGRVVEHWSMVDVFGALQALRS